MNELAFVLLRRIRSPLIVLVCVYSVSIIGFVLIPGMDKQGRPWHMDFFHSFYFVSFMGSTIGFGEIPYPFTDAQRLWTTFTIYGTVIAWLYAIGSLLALIQDSAFRTLASEYNFRRTVQRIKEPFYIICGYGGTGKVLVRAFAESGIRCVVVDSDRERISMLAVENLLLPVPGLCGDVAKPDNLLMAGLSKPRCLGVITVTDDDEVNLKVALTSKLLNPRLSATVRSESRDIEDNLSLFGPADIINPYDTFAVRLALALHAPSIYVLFEWLTGVPHERLSRPLFPPHGRWVLCGYGRFGKAVYDQLVGEGVEAIIVESQPGRTDAPPDSLVGVGIEKTILKQCNIREATGIVAGTDDDIKNLSIIEAARQVNPRLFTVARQNLTTNDAVFKAARIDLVMRRGSVIAHKIFAVSTTPLLADFLQLARQQTNDWGAALVDRIAMALVQEIPSKWVTTVDEEHTPALSAGMLAGDTLTLGELGRDPRNREQRLPVVPLLIKRGKERILLPADSLPLETQDQILYCGREGSEAQMEWMLKNHNVYHYLHHGDEHYSGLLARWLSAGKRATRESKPM